VATTILFESSGGQVEKVAHLPELRFALGEPEIDTTSIDSAALALESKAFFIRKVGSDGFQIRHQATLKKVVNDRRASLDEDTEIKPTMRTLVKKEFEKGASIPLVAFPEDSAAVQDSPRLTLVLMDPEYEWSGLPAGSAQAGSGPLHQRIAEWTKQQGKSPRLYPGSLIWCLKKPGRDLREKVELWLAWKRVSMEIAEGTLGTDFDRSDRADIQAKVSDAEGAAKDEVWAGYRFVVLADNQEADGLNAIDLGAGHASAAETLCGRIITALKSKALLNESVGAGYLDRNWPPALKDSGAWPLASLRQSFLNGALTRLLDPDTVLRSKIVEFVSRGDFGLVSGQKSDGTYQRIWYQEPLPPEEVTFDPNVFLLKKEKAASLKKKEGETGIVPPPPLQPPQPPGTGVTAGGSPETAAPTAQAVTLKLSGTVPPEVWNRLGTKIIPKLRSGNDFTVGVTFSVRVDARHVSSMENEIKLILEDLGLSGQIKILKE
jgi:hypothetical protein